MVLNKQGAVSLEEREKVCVVQKALYVFHCGELSKNTIELHLVRSVAFTLLLDDLDGSTHVVLHVLMKIWTEKHVLDGARYDMVSALVREILQNMEIADVLEGKVIDLLSCMVVLQ